MFFANLYQVRRPHDVNPKFDCPISLISTGASYAKAIKAIIAFAERHVGTTLYPGLHFDRLAKFLRKPFAEQTTLNYSPPFNFATLYKLGEGGTIDIRELNNPEELQQEAAAEGSSILFLRGQPCPRWLVHVGAAYHIDPEFFQRHLDLLFTMGRDKYFVQPSLLSTSRHCIQLGYTSIGELSSQAQEMSQEDLDSLRTSSGSEMLEYLGTVSKSMTAKPPTYESIVRSYHILDKAHFAIEQQISICFSQTPNGWTVVVWIDTGKTLGQDQKAPWAGTLRANQDSHRTTFLPWIQQHPFMALQAKDLSIIHSRRPTNEVEQSASLIHLDYGKTLDKQLMARDPFYAMHELFCLCASSKAQFLAVLESKILLDERAEPGQDQNLSPSNMMYFQNLLDNYIDKLQQEVTSIQPQDDPGWFQSAQVTPDAKSTAARQSLLKQYEALLRRSEILSDRCKARLNTLMNRAAIVESNKAIEQARVVTKLTRLAFFFTPLSFAASFFGMNLGPFATNPTFGLWLFFVLEEVETSGSRAHKV
ncbi:MAG: hypothetical protein M1822_000813 [Bathelium mastoideum]|nr:MAG: hypothetical protein M1822_000813 [Bathelium mastoideum]